MYRLYSDAYAAHAMTKLAAIVTMRMNMPALSPPWTVAVAWKSPI